MADIEATRGCQTTSSQPVHRHGVAGTKELYISCARHQAYVKVDEAGTEAAAATGGAGSILSAPGSITIDRPFLFLVSDTKNDTILLMGRVVDPSR